MSCWSAAEGERCLLCTEAGGAVLCCAHVSVPQQCCPTENVVPSAGCVLMQEAEESVVCSHAVWGVLS